jgi:hypothetical protein
VYSSIHKISRNPDFLQNKSYTSRSILMFRKTKERIWTYAFIVLGGYMEIWIFADCIL